MNKSLLALAALSTFAAGASAQSVTIYGKLDAGVGQQIGVKNKEVLQGAASRIGFKGVEDLGGGLKANFLIEHRFNVDTGTQNDTSAANRFWNGISTVGLSNNFGAINLGRQYTANYSLIQNIIDPFGADTVGQLRDFTLNPRLNSFKASPSATTLDTVRTADSVRLDFSANGFSAAYSIGENTAPTTAGSNKASSFAAAYGVGPVYVGVGISNPSGKNDKVLNLGGTYNFGFAKLALGYAKGTTTSNFDTKGYLIGATVPYGAIDFKLGYGQNKVENSNSTAKGATDSTQKKASFGAHYNLSKRTKVYADVARAGGSGVLADTKGIQKTAFDLGIQHNF